jgi:hypothetical protein
MPPLSHTLYFFLPHGPASPFPLSFDAASIFFAPSSPLDDAPISGGKSDSAMAKGDGVGAHAAAVAAAAGRDTSEMRDAGAGAGNCAGGARARGGAAGVDALGLGRVVRTSGSLAAGAGAGTTSRGGRLCKRPLAMRSDAVAAGAVSASSISTGAASGCASMVRPRSMNQYTGALCLVPVARAASAYSRSPRWHMKPARFRKRTRTRTRTRRGTLEARRRSETVGRRCKGGREVLPEEGAGVGGELDIEYSDCGSWTLAGGSLMFSMWWMLPSEGQRRMKPTILGKLGVWVGGPVFWRCDGVTSRSLLCGIVWKLRVILGFRRALRV